MIQPFEKYFENHISSEKPTPKKKTLTPQDVLVRLEKEPRENASTIARQGDFKNILETLRQRDLLDNQIANLQEHYWEDLESANFLTHEDWEALATLELYDTGTFEHCLKTYQIAKEKMSKALEFEGQEIIIRNKIKEEGLVSMEQFYRACLLHDIGKIEIPHFVINSEIRHGEWAELLLIEDRKNENHTLLEIALKSSRLALPDEISRLPEETLEQKEHKTGIITKFLTENEVPCHHYVPIENATNERLLGNRAFTQENMRELTSRGFSTKTPFFEIIKTHEKKSLDILKETMGLAQESILAGTHHDYENLLESIREEYPYTSSSFMISNMLAEFIRIADKFEAISSKRTYKDSETTLQALIDLAQEIDGNAIRYLVAYIWIKDDLEKIKLSVTSDEQSQIEQLEALLADFKKKI